MNIEIRPSKLKDLPQIQKIGSLMLPIYYSTFHLLPLILDENHTLLSAIGPDFNIIGFCISEKRDDGHRYHIKSIAVLPDYQRQGVASKFIYYLKNTANITAISLYVVATNTKAINFYKKHHIKPINKIHQYYENLNEDAYFCQWTSKKQIPI